MKTRDKEKLRELKKRYGKSFNKFIRVRKNYPFGKKSKPEITFERK